MKKNKIIRLKNAKKEKNEKKTTKKLYVSINEKRKNLKFLKFH